MSFDWDAIRKGVTDASKATDDELASEISSVTRLKDEEIKQLFPSQGDVEKFAKLMAIVNQATSENDRMNALVGNIQELSGAVLKVIRHFA